MMDLKKYGIAPVLLLYMVFPLTFSIGKAGMKFAPSTLFIAARMLLSGAVMFGVYTFFGRKKYKISYSDAFLLFKAALFGIYLTYIPEFWALQYMSVAKTAFLFVLAPFFTALFSRLHGMEEFSYQKIVGLTVGMLGFIPMFFVNTGQEAKFAHFMALDLPEAVTIFSVACYAYSWIIVKKLIKQKKYSMWFVNGTSMTLGGFGALITSFFYDGWMQNGIPITAFVPFVWYVFLIMIVGIICYCLYSVLLDDFSPTLISFFGFTEPFFAAFYGWLFLSETVSWTFFSSAFIVGFGLYLFYKEELKLGS
jgi:drug/metabolite transporter (DMT)-like permease